ncbi:hypothetical protein I302_108483 [Kwoniella bestiolae CBS 10118]|uniref:G-protein coupled receptors family 2 profile 2 domain-containing protein n=1 Tax=Kwoniella bestiolae CBS 10118 TaxID=1296100 RepID=A0A1B9FVK8_9TREE|nr:hypothetical protein I302_07141 [Kwoniella bestiolae CBS 10118]OCF22800.1 hypothetical protein I302_07141 [Kwoniella bestiolae CBS 10118]
MVNTQYWNAIGSVAAGISMILSIFILGSSWWIYRHKSARRALDRISFRLLLWSMAWEVAYSVDYFIVCGNPSFVARYSHTKACIAGAYFQVGTLGVVNWMCTCIAVNLMITICFNRDPIGLGLEKWYILGSTVLGLGVPIVPAILGHFGHDPVFGTCYFTSNYENRVEYLLLDLYLWQILSSVIATVAVVATLTTLIRHGRKTTRLLMDGNSLNKAFHREIENGESPASSGATDSFFENSLPSCLKLNTPPEPKAQSQTQTNRLQDKLIKIALRISLYPISLIIVNGIMTIGDLFLTSSGGINSKGDFIVFLIYNFMYAGRGIVFACLGIFVDPCLARGYKAALKERNDSQRYGTDSELRVKTPSTAGRLGFERSLPMIEVSDILPYKGRLLESEDYPPQGQALKQSKSDDLVQSSISGILEGEVPDDNGGMTRSNDFLAVSYTYGDTDSRCFTRSEPDTKDRQTPEHQKDRNDGAETGNLRYVRSESALRSNGDMNDDGQYPGQKPHKTGLGRGSSGNSIFNNCNTNNDTLPPGSSSEEEEIERIFQEAQTRL